MSSSRSGPHDNRIAWMALLVLAGAAGTIGPVTGQDPSWKAVAASGRVEASAVAETADWRSVARGDELAARSAVRTGGRGRATLARGADLLILDPGSEIVLPESSRYSTVEQTSGTVMYEVDGRVNPDFKVVTPYLVAGVKGTLFVVTVDDRGASVSVRRGVVEVTDPMSGDRLAVRAGEAVLRESGEPTFERVGPDSMDKVRKPNVPQDVTSQDDDSAAGGNRPDPSRLASRAPTWFDSWPSADAHGQSSRRSLDTGSDQGPASLSPGDDSRSEIPADGLPGDWLGIDWFADDPGRDWPGWNPGNDDPVNRWPGDLPPVTDLPPVQPPPVEPPGEPIDLPPAGNPGDSGPQNINRNP